MSAPEITHFCFSQAFLPGLAVVPATLIVVYATKGSLAATPLCFKHPAFMQ